MVVSQNRIAFKHLPKKDFEENDMKKLIYQFLADMLTETEIKKKKIIK